MFRLEEAIARARAGGIKDAKRQIAVALWPNLPYGGQTTNINNLCSGRTRRVAPEWIPIICSICGVSADWLFGIY